MTSVLKVFCLSAIVLFGSFYAYFSVGDAYQRHGVWDALWEVLKILGVVAGFVILFGVRGPWRRWRRMTGQGEDE